MTTRMREHEDLPILDDIGTSLSAALEREEQAVRRRRHGRRLRRIALATAALFVVVPGSVVATRWIWAPDPGVRAPGTPFAGSKPIQIAEGRGELVSWRLSAYMSEKGLCWQMAVFTVDESFGRGIGCQPDAIPFAPVQDAGGGEVIYSGVAPPSAASATLTTADGRKLTAVVVAPPPDRIDRAGLPKGLKFYVATLPVGPRAEDSPEGPPAVVIRDADGAVIARFPPPPNR